MKQISRYSSSFWSLVIFTSLALTSQVGCIDNKKNSSQVRVIYPVAVLEQYKKQTPFTDPGEYDYLYENLPESYEEICNLIKKQLIHPLEASEMKDILPEGRYIEDGDLPVVSDMLRELVQRNSYGLIMDRKPEDRLIIACYHHGLLLASILRSRGIPVRMRAGFARYFEEQANIRFGHVICEVWDENQQQWILVDPDRNYINMSTNHFEFPSEAWNNFRINQLPDVKYTSSLTEGVQALLHILLLDHAFTLGDERNYWHTPSFLFTNNFSIEDIETEQLKTLDQIATLMSEPENNLITLKELYDSNNFLHPIDRSISIYYEKMTGESIDSLGK